MIIEIVGKFYNNHSLTIINRNLAVMLSKFKPDWDIYITPLDQVDPNDNLDKNTIKDIKELEKKDLADKVVDIQIRHTYPPVWNWPKNKETKIIFIQPWEFTKAPFEWQYKFETFADSLIVPSNFCATTFKQGGIDPKKLFVVPNGYDPNVFNREIAPCTDFGIDPDRFNFVYVGNSQWRKGLDILLGIWHKVFKKYDKATLIIKDNPAIYGTNNIINGVIKSQFHTECGEIIYLDENLSQEQMASIFKASKVVVHPYRAEGFGMHVQEAMACGAFPIVSGNGPTDDFIPDDIGIKLPTLSKAFDVNDPNIFALKPGDSTTMMGSHTFVNEPDGQSLAKALQFIYHSHDKNKFDKINDYITPNTWDSVIEKYVEVFENVRSRKHTVRYR
tara:strand:+ start:2722 stop:3888 length:1167 start_codon:yes stop_codon:yes gene_type:complete